jgi:tetratricopeptide (TPR) repeat protein
METRRLAVLVLTTVVWALAGCARSPQAKEANFLKAGKQQLEKKDYSRATLQFRNAIQVMPKDAEPYFQLGLAYLGMKDLRAAIACFRRTTELNPKHDGARLKLAELMAASSNKEVVEEAAKRAEEVLATQPDSTEALNTLAFAELRLGRPQDAEKHLREALEKAPADLQSSISLARLRLAGKDAKGAESVLKRAVDANPKAASPLITLAEFYIASGRDAEAEQRLYSALKIDPENGSALLSLGGMQSRAGQNERAEQTYKQVSRRPEKQYKPIYALYLFQAGKRDAAIAEFEKLAKTDPADRDARTRLVSAYLAAQRVSDADKILTAALKKNEKDVDALLARSKIYLANGRQKEAQGDLHQVIRLRPGSAEGHYLLSRAYQADGDAQNRRQELDESLRCDARYLAARLELSAMLIAIRAPKAALTVLDEAPPDQKKAPALSVLRNWVFIALDDRPAARQGVDQLLAVSRSSDVLLQDATLKFDQKDFSSARSSLEELLDSGPDNIAALDLLVRTFAAQNKMAGATQKVREYVAKKPTSAPLQHFLGQLLRSLGRPEDARKAFEAAKANDASFVAADLSMAELDVAEGKTDPARKRLSDLLTTHPKEPAARLVLAGVEVKAGNPSAAIDHYRKAVAQDPRNLPALNNLAYLLADYSNQPDEAMKYAQQAKELAPDNASVDDTLGWIYYLKGLYTTAVKLLENSTAREATARHRYHLGMAYVRAGDSKRGRQVLEAALKMDPNLPEAQKALAVFAEAGSFAK